MPLQKMDTKPNKLENVNAGARSIRNRFLQFICSIIGIFFFVWVFSDPRFRDVEGFLDGKFCLPFSVGIGLIILGLGIAGRFRKSTLWFALALVGQAAALQMIKAGTGTSIRKKVI
jgi:hypothetical protein